MTSLKKGIKRQQNLYNPIREDGFLVEIVEGLLFPAGGKFFRSVSG
jgi:hypothetical protein